MMFGLLPVLIAGVAAVAPLSPDETPETPTLMAGKVDTGRSVTLEATLDASPQEVFRRWTTEEGIRSFFAPKAVIEPRLGGRFEIAFAPDIDPEGISQGTKGARILRFEPDRALSFEWHSFVAEELNPPPPPGVSAPPALPMAERNALPIPTWVDLDFEAVPGDPTKTHLRLVHRGFGTGQKWDDSRRYFWQAWARVLGRLGAVCAVD
jgi:uncharacterized protein YndB with AHSA1/START domain